MNVLPREKQRCKEYDSKLEKLTELEQELRKNLQDAKVKQEAIASRETELDAQENKIKVKEEKIKTLIEEEKRRATMNLQSNTKEHRNEITCLKDELMMWKQKCSDFESQAKAWNANKAEMGKLVSINESYAAEKERFNARISELEVKLEQALKAKIMYKTGLDSAEIKIQQLTEDSNRNKEFQLQDQREEINRLRSELAVAHQRSELANIVRMNQSPVESLRTQHPLSQINTSLPPPALELSTGSPHGVSGLPSTSTSSPPSPLKQNNPDDVFSETVNNSEDPGRFGSHPGRNQGNFRTTEQNLQHLLNDRAMFLKTKVYTEKDNLIIQLDAKIKELQDKLGIKNDKS